MDPVKAGGGEVVFRELQRFGQWWIWSIIVAVAGFAWFTAVYQLFLGKPLGGRPAPDWILVLIWLLFGLGLPLMFISSKLMVAVRRDGLFYRYYPFHLHTHRIAFSEIKKAEARTYSPVMEYGGWGIRYGWGGRGKAYNVSGNRGVQLELVDGRRVLFGSRKADELASAINGMMRP
ncbi:MAG: hypothetical protein C4536_08635 [Actinobacteria bacterium]|nr:MAG: hypothetical protein C4536_08635 [Actinomycetota bacterium]